MYNDFSRPDHEDSHTIKAWSVVNMHRNIYWQALKQRQSCCHVCNLLSTPKHYSKERFVIGLEYKNNIFYFLISFVQEKELECDELKESIISSPLCKLLQSHEGNENMGLRRWGEDGIASCMFLDIPLPNVKTICSSTRVLVLNQRINMN